MKKPLLALLVLLIGCNQPEQPRETIECYEVVKAVCNATGCRADLKEHDTPYLTYRATIPGLVIKGDKVCNHVLLYFNGSTYEYWSFLEKMQWL